MAEILATQTNKNNNDQLLPQEQGFKLGNCVPMELAWDELLISASINVIILKYQNHAGDQRCRREKSVIYREQSSIKQTQGHHETWIVHSYTWTFRYYNIYKNDPKQKIGSGKTTLLNFLSGRLVSENLTLSGELFLNSKRINDMDRFNDQIAYVMQDDILLATFTPRGFKIYFILIQKLEAFYFSANLRLRVSQEEKEQRVEQLISELGLTKCSNTRIGNNMIRGVSGGERKRASIGVELLTNPSLIFLDEPTTGLDSSTALQVVELLKKLAVGGRTIVSTIHQPSSEIFNTFDRLMLLVRGNIIYQGQAEEALDYFSKMGFDCPQFSNPSDFFMKLMNEEGLLVEKIQQGHQDEFDEKEIEVEFQQRVVKFIDSYQSSQMQAQLAPSESAVIKESAEDYHIGWISQFSLIYGRSFINEIRNPLDVKLKLFQALVNAIMLMIVYGNVRKHFTQYVKLGEYFAGVQNRNGALFFLTTTNAFGSIQGTLATCIQIYMRLIMFIVSMERALFLRERINKSYSVSAYFWARSFAEFPFQLLYPSIPVCIIYYVIGLNQVALKNFFILSKKNSQLNLQVFIQNIAYQYGVSYGLLISVLIPKVEVATALVPALIIPFMVLGGFFVNQEDIPYVFYPFEYLSMFKYGFQASAIVQYIYNKTDQNEYDGYTYYCAPKQPCDPVDMLSINIGLWENCGILLGLAFAVRVVSYIALHFISTPTKPKLRQQNQIKPEEK